VGQRIFCCGQRIGEWAASLPLGSADRSTRVHAQGKISAPCFSVKIFPQPGGI
jgi:hypothetical protein